MKIDSIKDEFTELGQDICEKFQQATKGYEGNPKRYESNRNRALIGLGVGFVGATIHPVVGIPALAYSALKGYQAVQDNWRAEHE